ncbi:MAG: hypothetical protein FWG94_07830 [Oscillospiraceae bacterium]|nr:hypothetical protein [Oscillospiraceae bacterium]
MKKLLSIVLIVMLTMSLSFVASADLAVPISAELSAYELYKAANEKMDGKSLEILGVGEMTMSAGDDIAMKTKMDFTAKVLENSKGELEMSTVATAEILGEQIKIEQYFKDGFLYQNAAGEKTKTEAPAINVARGIAPEKDIPEDFFEDAVVEEVAGGKRIMIRVSGNYMEELVAGVVDATSFGLLDEVRFGTATLWLTIGDDGMMKETAMVFRLSAEIEGITVRMRSATNMHIVSVGKVHSISFPWDLNSYELVEI